MSPRVGPRHVLRAAVAHVYRASVQFLQRLPRHAARRLSVPSIRLGTAYGGWCVADLPKLHGGLILSAGAGEDISFDVAVARRFAAKVIIVDPTPRAITHVEAVLARGESAPAALFNEGGHQSPDAYDLRGIKSGQLQLLPVALWNHSEGIEFFPPPAPEHVSYSATDYRRLGARTEPSLRVRSARLGDIARVAGQEISLLKLDIEGAETEVIADMLASEIRPEQVLVELDELAVPTRRHVLRAWRTVRALARAGYRLFEVEGLNYHFVRRSPSGPGQRA